MALGFNASGSELLITSFQMRPNAFAGESEGSMYEVEKGQKVAKSRR
jgi:hypothetical protein